MKTSFITGGTPGGFGIAYAEAALEAGDRVALTTRRPAEMPDWARPRGDRVLLLPLDVVATLESTLAEIRAAESLTRGADFPA